MALTGRVARCQRCYHPEDEHLAVNLTDGVIVCEPVLLCPTAVYQPPPRGQVHRVHKDAPVAVRAKATTGD